MFTRNRAQLLADRTGNRFGGCGHHVGFPVAGDTQFGQNEQRDVVSGGLFSETADRREIGRCVAVDCRVLSAADPKSHGETVSGIAQRSTLKVRRMKVECRIRSFKPLICAYGH